MTVRRSIATAVVLLGVPASAPCQEAARLGDERGFVESAASYIGLYAREGREPVIVAPHVEGRVLYFLDLDTGRIGPLEELGPDSFGYGPTIHATAPVEGALVFRREADGLAGVLEWHPGGDPPVAYRRVPYATEEISFRNGSEASLAGWLLVPDGPAPHAAAVLLHGSGVHDRFEKSVWLMAMTLLSRGVAALVYDVRGAGLSTGAPLPGDTWYEMAQVLSTDATAAVRFARSHAAVDPARVGVAGWSGGGWVGALVTKRIHDLAFYANIAGSTNPGWQQARWRWISELRWEGYPDSVIDQATAFADLHFGVLRGEVTWTDYETALERVRESELFATLGETLTVEWGSPEQAAELWRTERLNVPEEDLARVTAPTLGLFFEYDESSPPETPGLFLRGRSRSSDLDVTMRIFPDTSHEAFVTEGWITKETTREVRLMDPDVLRTFADWVQEKTQSRRP